MDLLRVESTRRRPSRPCRSVADEPDGERPVLHLDDADDELGQYDQWYGRGVEMVDQ
jgi:hypothetical protein